jgi:hypothetical protein
LPEIRLQCFPCIVGKNAGKLVIRVRCFLISRWIVPCMLLYVILRNVKMWYKF